MDEVYEFLKEKAPTYYLATVENGDPRVRPFGTVDLFEGKLYIQTGKNKRVYRQIMDHPQVEICACVGPEWLRLSGELVPDDRVEAKKHMLDKLSCAAWHVRRERRQHHRSVLQERDGDLSNPWRMAPSAQ